MFKTEIRINLYTIGDTGNLASDVTVYNQNEACWQKMASSSVVLSDYADKLPAEARKDT